MLVLVGIQAAGDRFVVGNECHNRVVVIVVVRDSICGGWFALVHTAQDAQDSSKEHSCGVGEINDGVLFGDTVQGPKQRGGSVGDGGGFVDGFRGSRRDYPTDGS